MNTDSNNNESESYGLSNIVRNALIKFEKETEQEVNDILDGADEKYKEEVAKHYTVIGKRLKEARQSADSILDTKEQLKEGYEQISKTVTNKIEKLQGSKELYSLLTNQKRFKEAIDKEENIFKQKIDEQLYNISTRLHTALDNTYQIFGKGNNIDKQGRGKISQGIRNKDPNAYKALDELIYQDVPSNINGEIRHDFAHDYPKYDLFIAPATELDEHRKPVKTYVQDVFIESERHNDIFKLEDFIAKLYLGTVDKTIDVIKTAKGSKRTSSLERNKTSGEYFVDSNNPALKNIYKK